MGFFSLASSNKSPVVLLGNVQLEVALGVEVRTPIQKSQSLCPLTYKAHVVSVSLPLLLHHIQAAMRNADTILEAYEDELTM